MQLQNSAMRIYRYRISCGVKCKLCSNCVLLYNDIWFDNKSKKYFTWIAINKLSEDIAKVAAG